MSYPVARPVQHEQEGHDADGHALASNFVGGIKRVCTYKKAKPESSEKASNKGKKGKKHLGTNSTTRVPKKFRFEKNCDMCKKHGGAYTTLNTHDCRRFKKDRKEKSNFCVAKKGSKKVNLMNHYFAQLTKKIKKLEKVLKKSA